MVGAVLVKGNKLLAKGYHHRAGLPHAGQKPSVTITGRLRLCSFRLSSLESDAAS